MPHYPLLLAFAIILTIAGCSKIEPFELAIEAPNTLEKIKTLKQVKIERLGNFGYSGPCTRDEAINTDYRILSSGTDTNDDYAIWRCTNTIVKGGKCSSLQVTFIRDNIVSVKVYTKPESVSKNVAISCALQAIDMAPTEVRATSEAVANRDSWK